jgi:hypothetical protein
MTNSEAEIKIFHNLISQVLGPNILFSWTLGANVIKLGLYILMSNYESLASTGLGQGLQ